MIKLMRAARGKRTRRGFALLTVLWVLGVATSVALSAALTGRQGFEAARNRIDADIAYWRANECAERSRAAIDELLSVAEDGGSLLRWRRLDRELAAMPTGRTEECSVQLAAMGAKLNLNDADEGSLRTLLTALGRPDADSLVDALLDWRDSDREKRPQGAEREWYLDNHRVPPRDGPFADFRELALVRGFENPADFASVLDVERARIPINSAEPAVLATVPGFSPEVVRRIAEDRERGEEVTDILALVASLSSVDRAAVFAQYPEIVRRTTIDPDAWSLTARGRAGASSVEATTELCLVRAGRRAIVLRRRTW